MSFITIDGENQIAAKFVSGTLDITTFVLANISGLGVEPVDRIEVMPAAGDIVDTQAVGKAGYVNNNLVVYSVTLDSTIGDYLFNWVGLVDAEGVLIAVTYLPALIPKTKSDNGIDGNNLVRSFLLEFSGVQALTAINIPAETWQLDLTTRLNGVDERERLGHVDVYGAGSFFWDGFLVTPGASGFVDIAPGVGYVGGLRCQLENTVSIDVSSALGDFWVDAYLLGDASGRAVAFDFVPGSAGLVDYVDGNGVAHFVVRIADVVTATVITDKRITSNRLIDHQIADDPHPQYLKPGEFQSEILMGSNFDVDWDGIIYDDEADVFRFINNQPKTVETPTISTVMAGRFVASGYDVLTNADLDLNIIDSDSNDYFRNVEGKLGSGLLWKVIWDSVITDPGNDRNEARNLTTFTYVNSFPNGAIAAWPLNYDGASYIGILEGPPGRSSTAIRWEEWEPIYQASKLGVFVIGY